MYELEDWDENKINFLSLYLKFRQSFNQFQHLINVSIRKTKTRDVLINSIKKADEVLANLVKFLEEYFSLIDSNFKSKPLKEKIEFFKEEFFGYDLIFDYIFKIKRALRAINENNYRVENEFKKNITLIFEDEKISIDGLRELERKILEFSNIIDRLINEVKSGKIERSYKIEV